MALSADEKQRARYHLGYPLVQTGTALRFGMVVPVQLGYLVDAVLNNGTLVAQGEAKVRQLLAVLDGIEDKLVKAQCRLAAASVDEIELRPGDRGLSEPDLLEREYHRWQMRLADALGVPPHVFSERSRGRSLNVSVA